MNKIKIIRGIYVIRILCTFSVVAYILMLSLLVRISQHNQPNL